MSLTIERRNIILLVGTSYVVLKLENFCKALLWLNQQQGPNGN